MKVTAAVTTGTSEEWSFEGLELDEPRADEVRVRLAAAGVCHTDAFVRGALTTPTVLGHEGAGVVEAVGDHVAGVAVGDHVVLSFAHCGRCSQCLRGHPAACREFSAQNFGCARADGTTALHRPDGSPVGSHFFGQSSFAHRAVVSASSCVVVPRDAPLALLAPLGCGVQTGAGAVLNTLRPEAGSSFAVFGAGAVGLAALLAAKASGCTTLIAVDVDGSRRDLARELGATAVVDGAAGDVAGQVRRAAGGDGPATALDTTGVPRVLAVMLDALATGGHAGIVGATARGTEAVVDVGSLVARGLRLSGIVEGDAVPAEFIPRLVALHRAGAFPFDRLIRHYPFEAIDAAFADSASGRTIKPVLLFDDEN